ncbi:hypothetical protein [Vibrio marisflavi]|uniref:Uncharacterized protein n=1 Tax=Vibrio marisflavi CECT 7928 TaxID=634439 RepID=A0ABM9A5H5_9VIBR|nr:hypothetical protein [Vibrio marisflavi]CAH0540431.1 hypothetical protein VMF7928_02851 [Vibrio marisflavi CECT 7928]
MKRASSTYRLQLIKEVASKKQQMANDPMANYIHQLLSEKADTDNSVELNNRFVGSHFDENAGGWISDIWGLK